MIDFVELRSETYRYITEDSDDENKKAKGTKKCVIKQKLNLKILKIIKKQLILKIKGYLKKKLNVDSQEENHKEFIRSNRLILRSQQR